MDLDLGRSFNQQAFRVMPATHTLSVPFARGGILCGVSVTDLHENSDILVILTHPRHVRAKHSLTDNTGHGVTQHHPQTGIPTWVVSEEPGQEERVVLPKDPTKGDVRAVKAQPCDEIPCSWDELG